MDVFHECNEYIHIYIFGSLTLILLNNSVMPKEKILEKPWVKENKEFYHILSYLSYP